MNIKISVIRGKWELVWVTYLNNLAMDQRVSQSIV